MLLDINELLSYYTDLFSGVPAWVKIVYTLLMLLPLIISLVINRSNVSAIGRSSSPSTINTVFWLSVMLVLPFFGILLYLAGSLLPYLIWKRHAVGNSRFPYNHKLRPRQLSSLLIAIIAGAIANPAVSFIHESFLADSDSFVFGNSFIFELSFLCWTAIILIDWHRNISRCPLYLRIPSLNQGIEQRTDLFGAEYARETGTYLTDSYTLRKEAKIVRAAADRLYRAAPYDPTLRGESRDFPYADAVYSVTVLGNARQWLRSKQDVVDSRYIGRGISRMRISIWAEQDGQHRGTEIVIYRAVPKLTEWLWRVLILLTVQLALCSPWAAQAHLAAAQLIERLISHVI